jgi:hypothetical protein
MTFSGYGKESSGQMMARLFTHLPQIRSSRIEYVEDIHGNRMVKYFIFNLLTRGRDLWLFFHTNPSLAG